MNLHRAFAALAAMCLAGCGPVLWQENSYNPRPDNLDGAVLSYSMANGEITFDAELKDEVLTLSTDRSVVARADLPVYRLLYSHSAISDDSIDIKFNDALVTSISSTTDNKTVPIVQAVTGILTQVSATQSAIQKANDKTIDLKFTLAPAPPKKCTDMKIRFIKSITHHSKPVRSYVISQATPKKDSGEIRCTLRPDITVEPVPQSLLTVQGFPGPQETRDPFSICSVEKVFCFRLGAMFLVKGKAQVVEIDRLAAQTEEFVVTAPTADALGYVRFDRRVFVKNQATITFASNGIVSGFSASNPSEVLGFLALPTAIGATVAAAALLH